MQQEQEKSFSECGFSKERETFFLSRNYWSDVHWYPICQDQAVSIYELLISGQNHVITLKQKSFARKACECKSFLGTWLYGSRLYR